MKKLTNLLAVVLALVMCLSIVAACGEKDTENNDNANTTANTTTPSVTTTTAQDTTTADTTTNEGNNFIEAPTVDVPADGMIKDAAQLHAVLVNGVATANYTVTAKTLDMTNYKWTGLTNYSGTFDFGGCVISGAAYSFFNSVNGATIKNLTLANCEFIYTDDMSQADPNYGIVSTDTNPNNKYFAPVVRVGTNFTVTDVVVESTVKIKIEIWTAASSQGGIIGMAYGENSIVENCTFKGELVTDSMDTYIGGIVGEMLSSSADSIDTTDFYNSAVRIVNCVNTGTVSNLNASNENSQTGGINGRILNGVVLDCSNSGTITCNDGGQTAGITSYVGGDSYVKNCINTGEITGNTWTGGICGYSNAKGKTRVFENCINLGKVTSTRSNSYGGIIGLYKMTETMTNCFNLTTAVEQFAYADEAKTACNPADSATHGSGTITDCGNLATIDEIFTAIDNLVPGVFEKSNGTIVLAGK